MAYKTGRTHTIEIEASLSATIAHLFDSEVELQPEDGFIDYDHPAPYEATPGVSCSFAGCSISARRYVNSDIPGTPFSRLDWEYGIYYVADANGVVDAPAPDVLDFGSIWGYGVSTPNSHQATGFISATGTITVNVEEWAEPGPDEVADDGTITAPLRLYMATRPGGKMVADIGNAHAEFDIVDSVEVVYGVDESAGQNVLGGTAYASVSATLDDIAIVVTPTKTRSQSGDGWSVSLSAGSSVTTTVTSAADTGGTVQPSNGQTTARLYPNRQVDYRGIIRAFEQPYPAVMKVVVYGDPAYPFGRVVSASDVWSATFAQKRYEVYFFGRGGGSLGTELLNEWTATSCKLQAAALLDASENANASQADIAGWRWAVGTLSQAASLQLAGSWTAIDDTPYDLPDDDTADGAQGSHSPLYAGKVSADGYRYLKLPLKHDGDDPITLESIQLGTKTWSHDKDGVGLTVPNGGTYTNIIIDLCNPDGTETTDTQDSKFPILRADSWAWGVTFIESIILKGIPADTTFTAEKAELVRLNKTRLIVCPAHNNFVEQDSLSDNPHQYRNDFLRCETDGNGAGHSGGKTSQQQSDIIRATTDPFAWSPRSIQTIKNWIMDGTYPSNGFSMTANAATGPTDELPYYLCETAPAWCLWHSGAWWNGTEWKYAIDLDMSAGISIVGQTLHTVMTDWYPNPGDWAELGGYGAMILRVASFLRGRAIGLVLGLNNESVPDTTVRLTNLLDSTPAGTGVSDAIGAYNSDLPFVYGGREAKVECEAGELPYSNVTALFAPRKSLRIVFRPVTPTTGDGLAYDVSPAKRHAVMWREADTLRIAMGEGVIPTFPSPVDTEIDGSRPRIRWERSEKSQRLYLVYVRSDVVYSRYTTDEGENWSSEVTIGTGTFPDFVVTPDSRRLFNWRNATEGIDYKILDGSNSVIENGTTNITSGVDADDIAVRDFNAGGGEVRIGLFYRSSGTLTYVTSTNGKDFS